MPSGIKLDKKDIWLSVTFMIFFATLLFFLGLYVGTDSTSSDCDKKAYKSETKNSPEEVQEDDPVLVQKGKKSELSGDTKPDVISTTESNNSPMIDQPEIQPVTE